LGGNVERKSIDMSLLSKLNIIGPIISLEVLAVTSLAVALSLESYQLRITYNDVGNDKFGLWASYD